MAIQSVRIYINDVNVFTSRSEVLGRITNSGMQITNNTIWTYSGSNTFLGFSTNEGATTPDEGFMVGQTYTFEFRTEAYYLYSVEEAPQPPSKTVINGLTPTKKMFGTTEIVKEVVNGVIVYEKQVAGYSGNITTSLYDGGNNSDVMTYIKFGSAPTGYNDYDSYVDTSGTLTGATSYVNQTKVYVWGLGTRSGVRINNVYTSGGSNYSNAVEITLTGNYDIVLAYVAGDDGGS